MRKMPCLFQRVFHDNRSFTLLKDITPGCEWALSGEAVPSRKWDGTACLVKDGKLFNRYDAKNGKPAPANGIPCDPHPDPVTGHWPHWVPVGDEPESKWHRAAWERQPGLADGTYELCGPHICKTEGFEDERFIRHGEDIIRGVYLTWDGIHVYLKEHRIEGIVFTHPDGRMCKIRRDDYGLEWKPGRR